MHQLVGKPVRQRLQHLLRVVAAREQLQRALHLFAARFLA